MKKRSKGVGRLLKARQNLKNIAKELGIPLEEVFNEAAVLKKKRAAEPERLPLHKESVTYDLVEPFYEIANQTPDTSGRVREAGLSGDTRNVATERSEGSNPSPSANPMLETMEALTGVSKDILASEGKTTLYGEPVQIATQQPRPGDHADGMRIAEADPSTPDNAPYYVDRCTACHEEMMSRSAKEDICQTCAIVLRDETVEAIRSMESKATGQLVNPFKDPFGEE